MSKKEPQALISAEKQFLYRDSFNRGFIQLPRMTAACLCLSAQARTVYNAISMFIYEHGRSAFPSIHRIATTCDMSAKSVIKYIKELEDKGFIKKVRRGSRMTNDYYVMDVHEVQSLRISEMIWKVLDGIARDMGEHSWEQIDGAWKKLQSYAKETKTNLTSLECNEEVSNRLRDELMNIMKGGNPTLVHVLRVSNKTKTAGVDKAPINREGKTYKDRHESEWKTDNFKNYFYEKYRELTGMSHPEVETVHRTIIKRALKQLDGDKFELRKHIDAFFEIGYDNLSLEQFGTSGRMAEIALYMREGKKPFYVGRKTKQQEASKAEQQYLGADEDELLERLKRRRGEGS